MWQNDLSLQEYHMAKSFMWEMFLLNILHQMYLETNKECHNYCAHPEVEHHSQMWLEETVSQFHFFLSWLSLRMNIWKTYSELHSICFIF